MIIDYLKNIEGLNFSEGKLVLPSWARRIRVDIGLSICAPHSEIWLREQPNDLIVFGFEPNLDACRQIRGEVPYENDWPIKLDPQRVGREFILIPIALGKNEGSTQFYVTDVDQGRSSVFKPKGFDVKRVETVQVIRLDRFLDVLSNPVEYLKIDAQGSDLDILKSAGKQLSEKVVYLTAECEQGQYEGTNNSANSMRDYLEGEGFIEVQHPSTVDPTFINRKYLSLMAGITPKQLS